MGRRAVILSVQAVPAGRGGHVLIGVLLVLLSLSFLAHGALLRASADRLASSESVVRLRERLATEAAIEALTSVLGSTESPGPESVEVGGSLGDTEYWGRADRLTAETVLLEGWSRSGPRPGRSGAGRAIWFLDPAERAADLNAWYLYGGNASGAVGPVDAPPATSDCALWLAEVAGRRGGPLPPPLARGGVADFGVVDPAVPGGPIPALGALSGPELLARLPHHPSGELGLDGPVALAAVGSLRVSGGAGEGVLAVSGDLRLSSGTEFSGLLLVGGSLVVEPGASLAGVSLVRSDLSVAAAATASVDPCALRRALDSTPSLLAPLSLEWARWMLPGD